MALLLSDRNLAEYLVKHNLCTEKEQDQVEIWPIPAKNFNLLARLPDGRKLLSKQERYNQDGKTAGEFLSDVKVQEFLRRFPELERLSPWLPAMLHFDAENSIIVFRYMDEYRDLADFYAKENIFPIAIASSIGTILATIHRTTFNRQDYRDFFSQSEGNQVPNLIRSLERISPEIFGLVPADGLKFFALYQRYDSLGQAMAELSTAFTPCCLTHNDLKLNNILIYDSPENSSMAVRLIDWERGTYGDPEFDLGMLIASYLQIWLGSLVISNALSIEESLRLAATPLELLQPSIAALMVAYLDNFPEILEHRPDFNRRVVQFAGFALIEQIQAIIQYQKTFGNTGIVTLQVAKALLCRPEQSMPTVFGEAAADITRLNRLAA